MLVTIKYSRIDKERTENRHRILTVFPQLISQFDMNHKMLVKVTWTPKGISYTEKENTVTGTKNQNTLTAQFDHLARLINLKG